MTRLPFQKRPKTLPDYWLDRFMDIDSYIANLRSNHTVDVALCWQQVGDSFRFAMSQYRDDRDAS